MHVDLDLRTITLSVGEFADFTLGPHPGGTGGQSGLWRAQLGTLWHRELRARATAEQADARFEVAITGRIAHRGWILALTGRIDQLLPDAHGPALREIKSVTLPLPADESELRATHPAYFIQLATYAALARLGLATTPDSPLAPPSRAELVFVEAGSGLVQIVPLSPADETLFQSQLERVTGFLDQRLRARLRLRDLRCRPPFTQPRPGQETTCAELTALFQHRPLVLFEAPTGFGKTGVLLEFALGQLRSGHFDRALYLTGKSTGQIQVVRTLQTMTSPDASVPGDASTPLSIWHVRNKAEHCVNATFHCVRETCSYLTDLDKRWARGGLARFYLDERHARDLDTLRAAGRDAGVCPYEITRAALAFADVWIGDYNYVFSPRNRGFFHEQPGFDPARTLLLIDEAHNLPGRAADAHSHLLLLPEALAARDDLARIHAPAPLLSAWDHWCHFLRHLHPCDSLSPVEEDDALHLLSEIARLIATTPPDFAGLGPTSSETLWSASALPDELKATPLPRLWWSPRQGELALSCLDAAPSIGATLREFGGVVLASATLSPIDGIADACGLETAHPPQPPPSPPAVPEKLGALTRRDTRALFRQLTSAAELLRLEEARSDAGPAHLRALTPWRDDSYEIAFDARVDTTFQHRSLHYTATASTIATLSQTARLVSPETPTLAVFFPSYAYAEAIQREASVIAPSLRIALQPRKRELNEQSSWVEESLRAADALFLVLGSGFAEGIDVLGGRISHAMVVGPALPEVNAMQRARMEEATRAGLDRTAAFRRVYQIPGMIKVNQALGRLVRAPGQRARVVLHCRRFLDPGYSELLAAEYRSGSAIHADEDLVRWLDHRAH